MIKGNLRLLVTGLCLITLLAMTASAADVGVIFLNQEPDPVEPGEYVELRYKIENTRSEDLYDVRIEFDPQYPFTFDSEEDRVKLIPKLSYELEGKKAITVKLRSRIAEDAIEGDYNIKLLVSSSSYKGVRVHEQSIAVKSREMMVVIDSIDLDPEKPKPGDTVTMDIGLINLGYSPLYDVKVKLDVKGSKLSPIGSTNEKILNKISSKETGTVTFNIAIDADAEAKIQKVPMIIEFKDKFGEVHTLDSLLGIKVFAPPEYIMNLEDSNIYVTGQQGEIVISLSNIGISNINFVTMELLHSENYELLSNPKIYVGNLESDDYETAEFKIFTKRDIGGLIPLEVVLKFKDSYNKDYEDLVEVPLKMYSRREASKLGLVQSTSIVKPLIVLIILGVAGFLVYKKWWKMRVKKNLTASLVKQKVSLEKRKKK